MSFWIHAFCNESVASVTTQELTSGIAERLKSLTYLFCPDKEENPDVVLARLKIEDRSTDGTFRVFLIYYRSDSPLFIRVDRIDDARGSIEEFDGDVLAHRSEPAIARIRQMLKVAKEQVSFCLKADDVDSMGFPLSIAAASYLVKRVGGVIQSGNYSWMVPSGKEVDILAEFSA